MQRKEWPQTRAVEEMRPQLSHSPYRKLWTILMIVGTEAMMHALLQISTYVVIKKEMGHKGKSIMHAL